MHYRILGRTGVSVSELCLGTMNFGVPTAEAQAIRITHQAFAVAKALRPLAQAHGKSLSQVALAWALANRAVTSVIIGPLSSEQLEDHLGASGWSPSTADEQQVDALVLGGEHTGKGCNDPQYPVRGRGLA